MADLAGQPARPSAQLAVEHEPAADAGAHEDAEHVVDARRRRRGGARPGWPTLTSLSTAHRRRRRCAARSELAERHRVGPSPRRFGRADDHAVGRSTCPGVPTPDVASAPPELGDQLGDGGGDGLGPARSAWAASPRSTTVAVARRPRARILVPPRSTPMRGHAASRVSSSSSSGTPRSQSSRRFSRSASRTTRSRLRRNCGSCGGTSTSRAMTRSRNASITCAVAEVGVDLPVRRDRAEVDDAAWPRGGSAVRPRSICDIVTLPVLGAACDEPQPPAAERRPSIGRARSPSALEGDRDRRRPARGARIDRRPDVVAGVGSPAPSISTITSPALEAGLARRPSRA